MKTKTKTKPGVSSQESAAPAVGTEAASPQDAVVPSSGEFKLVPRGLLRPDPNQPRTEFSESALAEMALSIYLQGIIQPLVVKHVPAALVIHEPDLHLKTWQATDPAGAVVFEGDEESVRRFAGDKTSEYYQIITGERRWRSTEARTLEVDGKEIKWAGLKELPVMVRQADDRATFALQHMENQKRLNLSALEEARSFGRELEARRAADPAFTAERLGEELGIKRGTVFNLMKLLRLKEPVRRALIAGEIETSHARAIAAVPDIKRQEELLERVAEDADYGEDRMSVRQLEELIDDEYVKQLKDAPFDKDDEKLLPVSWLITAGENEMVLNCTKPPQFVHPATIGIPRITTGTFANPGLFITTADKFELAGPLLKKEAKNLVDFITANTKAPSITATQQSGWACAVCPHRSGVMDPTTKTPNVCTLPTCFDAKVKAHWVKKSEELRAKGTPVLTEGEMRKKGRHIPADKHEYTQNKSGTFKELMGKHAPEPVLVATKEGIKKFYPAEDAIAAAKKNGVKFYSNASAPKSASDAAKEKEEREKREQAEKRREEIIDAQWENLAAGIAKVKESDAWEIVLQLLPDFCLDAKVEKFLIKAAKTARGTALGRLLGDDDRLPIDYQGDWEEEHVALWKRLGVDLVALDKEAERAAQPKLPLAKPAPQQKTLLEVKQKGPKRKAKGKKK